MSGSSSIEASGFKQNTESGFKASEVNSFLQSGDTQGSGRGLSGVKRTDISFDQGAARPNVEFSDKVTSQGQLDLLVNTFLKRERQISQRKAQTGRSSLFLGRQ